MVTCQGKYVVHCVTGGTKLALDVHARNIDSAVKKLQKNRFLKKYNNIALLFFARKTGKLVDTRVL